MVSYSSLLQRRAIDDVAPVSIRSSQPFLSLSLSLPFSRFHSLIIARYAKTEPGSLSLISNGLSYQMYMSVAILDFASRRMSRSERLPGPTGTD